MRVASLVIVVACLGAAAMPAIAAPFTPKSLYDLRVVEDVEITADGKRIVYELTHIDAAQDRYERDLWLMEGENEPRPLVTAAGDDSRPRWSPDGKRLAFLSARQGHPQIYILEMSGGEPWRLTNEEWGVGPFSWSPDGSRIAYLSRAALAKPQAKPVATSGTPPAAPPGKAALITERMFYRFDGFPGFLPEGRSKLFVTEVRANAPAPVGPLTDGHNEPSEPAWSPDGRWLVYSTVPLTWRAEVENDAELYRVRADGQGEQPEQLTDRHGPDEEPLVERKSGLIAWTGFDEREPLRMSSSTRLYVMQTDGSGRRELTTDFDRNVGETQGTDAAWLHGLGRRLAFSRDGKQVLFVASDRGVSQLYSVSVNGGQARVVPNQPRGDLREIAVAASGTVAAIFGSPTQAYEIWTAEQVGKPWRKRTDHALPAGSNFQMASYEELWFESFDAQRIQGWLIKPPGFDPARKYPLILYIHGGPNAMYGENFYHEFQVLASAGYVVLLTNPRGSTGYGETFANAVQYQHPGDDAYRDLMAGVDAALKLGFIDERRLGIAGGSAGGTLAAWTLGRTPRFAAALVERPAVNWYSFVPATDVGIYFAQHWFRDFPWRDPDDYIARSPLSLIDKVTTPVLIMQSIEDYRTTVDQGLQYYGALKMTGKKARLALFPLSSHSLSRNGPASQRVQRLEIILDWFNARLQP